MNDIKTAAQALVDKLDIAMPLIEDHNIRKENLHTPIDVRSEIKALKDAIERDKATAELVKKAIYELVKHDQEIGLYDE